MKNFLRILPLALLFMAFAGGASAQNGKLKISWSFKNVVEGYDHMNKCEVFIDGEKVGSSTAKLETKKNKMSISVPTGEHNIRVVNWALYDGKWEEHTVANNYSLDCIVDDNRNFGKSNALAIVFDIDSGTTFSWK